jgi:two-component system OmpR family response regulator
MGGGRVLIVEDEADLAWLERFYLEEAGYDVHVAAEGGTAVRAIAEFGPDVLVLDVMVPNLDGWTILSRARELPGGDHLRVILVSAMSSSRVEEQVEAFGVRQVLMKPFDMSDLVRAVGETLNAA